MSSERPPLVAAAIEVLLALDGAGHRACLIGGMAVARWGEPRVTADVDVSVLAPYGGETPVIDALLERFEARVPDARAFANNHRVLLLRTTSGVALDLALAALPFEIEALNYASDWLLGPGVVLRTCSAEHLIIYKLVAARPRDLVDVESMVRRQGRHLDLQRIRSWGAEFAAVKEDPGLLEPFEHALRAAR